MSDTFPHSVYACGILFKKKLKDEDGRVAVCFHLEVITARSEGDALATAKGCFELPEDCEFVGITAQVIPDEVILDIASQQAAEFLPPSISVN